MDIEVPFIPDNVALPAGKVLGMSERPAMTGEVWHFAQKLKELDPRLKLVVHENHEQPFVVMEFVPSDGKWHFVSRYTMLDERVLENLRYMQHVPFSERFKATAARIDKENAERDTVDQYSEAMERMAFEFKHALKDSGIEPLANVPVPMYKPKGK